MITIPITCNVCKQRFNITVSQRAYEAWNAGELIQRAMPELTPAERELLISQTCGECFDKMFPPEEENE